MAALIKASAISNRRRDNEAAIAVYVEGYTFKLAPENVKNKKGEQLLVIHPFENVFAQSAARDL